MFEKRRLPLRLSPPVRLTSIPLILIPAMLIVGVFAVRAVLSKPFVSSLSITSASVIEGDGGGTVNLDFTVTLSPADPAQTVTVDFRTSTTAENIGTFGGQFAATASPDPGADYVSQTGTVIFNPGDTSKTISVLVNKDCLPERDEFLRVLLSNPVNATLGGAIAQGTITSDDNRNISIGDASVIEGDGSGTVTLDFPVSLSGPPVTAASVAACGPVTVDFRTSTTAENIGTFGGQFAATASPDPGADYISQTGTVSFNAGDTSKTISILVNKDCLPERDESLRVLLSNPINANFTNIIGTGTITTDDNRSISIGDASVIEGDGSGSVSLDFTVSLSGPPVTAASVAACGPITVDFRTSTTAENIGTFGGQFAATASPDPGADYISQTGTVTFNAGDTSKTISILVNKDCLPERDESLRIFLSNPINANLTNTFGTGTITTDDNRSISIGDASVIEGDGSGTVSLNFTVSLNGSPVTAASVAGCGPVTVDFRTSTTAENIGTFGGQFAATASPDPGADYISQTGTVTFNAGDTSKIISILVNKDCLPERDESLRIFLSNPVNTNLSNTIATGTITTDDNRSVSISGGSVSEGDGSSVNLDFTVSLSGSPVTAAGVAACGPVTVDFRTSTTAENVSQFGGSFAATASPDANSDYITQNGTLTFNPGETTKIISVIVTPDCLPEFTESLSVRLSNPMNTALTNNNATGSIINNVASSCLSVTNTNDSGDGSLRQAIGNANVNGDLSTITFNIPGSGPFTISPASPLPQIINPVVIDGFSQPGSSPNTDPQGDNAVLKIELDGSNTGGSTSGLTINTTNNCDIKGLIINRFPQNGIQLLTTTNSIVEGNFIGTDSTGTVNRGNGLEGILLQATSNAVIGGTTVASRNVIAFNTSTGVTIASGTGNTIRGNNIFGNGGLGIDLLPTGVNPNDSCDGDGGPNNQQNSPVITAAIRSGASTVVTGTLNSAANTTFILEFFANPGCHSSGSGDGRSFIGSAQVTTDAGCMANINVPLPGLVPLGTIITATATDPAGNTSEFSACSTPTAVELADLAATSYDSGVLVQWQTGFEIDNLGFNVFRDRDGKRVLINPGLIAGSALRVGKNVTLHSGQSYAWWDSTGDNKSTYWVEALDLNGVSRWYGPVSVQQARVPDRDSEKAVEQSKLLGSISASKFDSTPIERRVRLTSGTDKSRQSQLALASGPAVKLSIKHEGWYRVTQPELIAAGLSPSVDPRLLQLYVDGLQLPISLNGGSDGRFNPSDSIEFYGVGLDSPFSEQHIYWLVAGRDPGLRIIGIQCKTLPLSGGGFAQTVERRDRSTYFPALLNGETENFFGALVASQPVPQALTVRHKNADDSQPSTLEVALQGVSVQPHMVRVSLNGVDLGAISFDGQSRGVSRFSVPATSIVEGENIVLLTSTGAQDSSLVDYIRLTYDHAFVADDEVLRFTAYGQQQVTIGGFIKADIRVFDVTDPMSAQELIGSIDESKMGCSVSLRVPSVSGPRELLALASSRAMTSDRIASNVVSNLKSPAHAGELIVVTHRDFAGRLQPLVAARLKQGLGGTVVDVEDIYDEFSFGNKTPYAIRDFLNYAKTSWKKPPRYVLLAGCASYDPKNFLGAGDIDFVPTKLIDTSLMETSSDDWLVDFDQDGMPDLAIGRLPFRSAAEADHVIARIVGYDQAQPSEQTLLVADKNEGYNFESVNDQLYVLVDPSVRVVDIRRGQTTDSVAKASLIAAINRGQKIVNYAGHGSVDLWRTSLFTSADVTQLTNSDHLSVFVMMDCLNGYFDDPLLESLGAALLNAPQGGAVAVWASSAMTTPDNQTVMNRELYRQLFGNLRMRLGDAVRNAKSAIPSGDVRRSWILLGDPTMRFR